MGEVQKQEYLKVAKQGALWRSDDGSSYGNGVPPERDLPHRDHCGIPRPIGPSGQPSTKDLSDEGPSNPNITCHWLGEMFCMHEYIHVAAIKCTLSL